MKKIVTGRPSLLKEINRNIITKLVVKHGEISRSEISRITKLALPSVMRLVDGLIEDGIILDIGKGESSGGRKPKLLTLNKDAMYIIGVEIAIETSVVLTNLLGDVIEEWTSNEMEYSTPTEMLEKIEATIEKFVIKNNIPEDKIAGIGIGTPGTNFKYTREIEYSILKGWEQIDVKAWFEARTERKVFVDNVARTRTLSELWFGRGKDLNSFIYVFVDQGVGCGIVINQNIYEGYNQVAGEFGHSVIDYKGRPCYCGNDGCIEMYVSAGAIANDVKKALGSSEDIKLADVISKSEDDLIKEILISSGEILSVGIGNLINSFNPQAIVLGGKVSMELDIIRETVNKEINKNIFSNFSVDTPVYTSSVTREDKCIGSIALVINNIFKSIEL